MGFLLSIPSHLLKQLLLCVLVGLQEVLGDRAAMSLLVGRSGQGLKVGQLDLG